MDIYLKVQRNHVNDIMQKCLYRMEKREKRREEFIRKHSKNDRRAITRIALLKEFEKREAIRERSRERHQRLIDKKHQEFCERERIKTRNYEIGAKKRAYNKLKDQFIEAINFPE